MVAAAASVAFPKTARYAFLFDPAEGARERPRGVLYDSLAGYYYNTVFGEHVEDYLATVLLADWNDQASIKGLLNPTRTLVNFYKTYTLEGEFGDDITLQPFRKGGTLNRSLLNPVEDIWRWSNFDANKDLVGFFGSMLGDVLLVAVDDDSPDNPANAKVWFEVRHPGELVDYDFDPRGFLTYARLDQGRTERDSRGVQVPYTYTVEYRKADPLLGGLASYATYKDGKPFDFRGQASGTPMPDRWENPHGFVPIVTIQHERIGDDFGMCAFAQAIPIIDELCLRASHVGDLIGKYLAPQWLLTGIKAGENGLPRDGSAWFGPLGADAKALVAQLQASESYVHLKELLTFLRDTYPELSFAEARKQADSGRAARIMLGDAIKAGERAQRNYSQGVVRAFQMCLTMGSNVGGSGRNLWIERGYGDIGAYEETDQSRNFEFRFTWAPIIPLDELEQLQIEAEQQALKSDSQIRRSLTQPQDSNGLNAPVASTDGPAPNDGTGPEETPGQMAERLLNEAGRAAQRDRQRAGSGG